MIPGLLFWIALVLWIGSLIKSGKLREPLTNGISTMLFGIGLMLFAIFLVLILPRWPLPIMGGLWAIVAIGVIGFGLVFQGFLTKPFGRNCPPDADRKPDRRD